MRSSRAHTRNLMILVLETWMFIDRRSSLRMAVCTKDVKTVFLHSTPQKWHPSPHDKGQGTGVKIGVEHKI